MPETKYKRSIVFKIISLVVLFCFIINDISFAVSGSSFSTNKTTLAVPTELYDPHFREKFRSKAFLFGDAGAKRYIESQIKKEKAILGKEWKKQKSLVINVSEQETRGNIKDDINALGSVWFVGVTGLLNNTGRLADIKMNEKDHGSGPVVYVDGHFFNDPKKAIQKHYLDIILQWENLRLNVLRLYDRQEMRIWIDGHLNCTDDKLKGSGLAGKTSYQISKLFQERAYPLKSPYKGYKNISDLKYEYIDLIMSLYAEKKEKVKTSKSDPLSNLSQEETIKRTLQQFYDLGSINWIKKRVTKTKREVYVVDTSKNTFLFTTVWEGFPESHIDLMSRAMDHLVAKGFKSKYFIPEIIKTKTGENYVQFQQRPYYLRKYKKGAEALDLNTTGYFTEINIAQLKGAARMLAEYHKAIEGFEIKGQTESETMRALTRRAEPLRKALKNFDLSNEDDLIRRIKEMDIPGNIREVEKNFKEKYKNLPQSIIHGDFQPMNILFNKDVPVGLIDFELIKKDIRLVDFIAGILEMEKGSPKINGQRIEIFFDEYMQYGNLTMEELEAMPFALKLNYLNRIAVAVTDRYERLQSDPEYREYIKCCLQRVHYIDTFDWANLIKPIKIRQIIAKRDWQEQVFLLEQEFQNRDAPATLNTLLAILHTSTYNADKFKSITLAEKMRFFSKALSLAIKGLDGQNKQTFFKKLDMALLETPEQFEPEARFLARSYLEVASADVEKGTKVTTVISCNGEQDCIRIKSKDFVGRRDHYVGDDDFLRTRIEQIQDLFSTNENIVWELVLVGDGDDREKNNFKKHEKTVDIARRIVEAEYSDLYKNGTIRILELSERKKREIGSQKGGAICYGMRDALNHGAKYVFFINAVAAYHAGQEGLLLKELLGGADMAVASRKTARSISKRSWLRELKSFCYNLYLRSVLPWVSSLSDTQAGFKAFTGDSLKEILPVDINGDFDKYFDYGLSFDTDLISRYKILNKGVIEVPVVRINFPNRISTTDSPLKIIKMILGVLKQRLVFLRKFQNKLKALLEDGKNYFQAGQKKGESYSVRIYKEENTIRVESMSLHQGDRSVIFLKKGRSGANYIRQYLPVALSTAKRGVIGSSALKKDITEISTMEHLASAIRATGIDGLDIRLYGQGCPILEGDSLAWVNIFEKAGWVEEKNLERNSYNIQQPIILLRRRRIFREFIHAFTKFRHSHNFKVFIEDLVKIVYPKPGYDVSPIKNMVLPLRSDQIDSTYISVLTLPYMPDDSRIAEFTYDSFSSYKNEIAPAKTFVPFPLWERQGQDMFIGALPGKNILTLFTHKKNRDNKWTSKLKWPDEPARHKIADLIGDIYLTESEMGERTSLKGCFISIGNGHRDNIEVGSMIKKSIEISKEGGSLPVMADILPDGRLEYLDYDAGYVLKQLKKLKDKGYFKKREYLYERMITDIKNTSNIPVKTSFKMIFKNTFLMSSAAAVLFYAASVTQLNIFQCLSIVSAVGAFYHLLQMTLYLFAKTADSLNGLLRIPTKLNVKRERYVTGTLGKMGADKVTFTDTTYIGGITRTFPDKTVEVGDWILNDSDFGSFDSFKGFVATIVAGINHILKELLIRVVILDHENKKLKWERGQFFKEHSYLLHPYSFIFRPFLEMFKKEKEEDPAEVKRYKVDPAAVSLAEDLLLTYDPATWREKLRSIIDSTEQWEDVVEFLTALSLRSTVDKILKTGKELETGQGCDVSIYENIMAKAVSLALRPEIKCNNRERIRKGLEPLSEDNSLLRPEAVNAVGSYLSIFDLGAPLKVSTLFAMYNEQRRIVPIENGGEDFLRLKIEHLEDLTAVNKENFKWELVLVNDGDDKEKDLSLDNKRSSLEMARDIVSREYPGYFNTNKIRFFSLPPGMRREIKSRKGGAIMYGIWKRLIQDKNEQGNKPDIFILTDADKTIPLSFEGLLLPHVLDNSVGMAIGSANKNIERKSRLRPLLYKVYNRIVQLRLRELRGIEDTMMGFKAARTSVLETILPFSLEAEPNDRPRLDPSFVPRGSFDDDMLCRVKTAGFDIIEVPVTWVHSELSSFSFKGKIESFYDSLLKVPKDVKYYREHFVGIVEKWLSSGNSYQRWRKIDELVGSSVDSDKASTYLWFLLSKYVYKKRSISKYLNKETRKAFGHLTKQERTELLSHAVSLYLRRSDGKKGYDHGRLKWLKTLLEKRPGELLPEARILIESYIEICNAPEKKIAVVSHLFGSRRKLLTDRINQLKDLIVLNPGLEWSFYWVTQDDAVPGFPGSIREAREVLAATGTELKDKIKIIKVPLVELARVQSFKGGSLAVGMAESVRDEPDYILGADMNTVPNLAQAGLIIASLRNNNNDLAIASRRLLKSVNRRVWFRRMYSYALNKWIWLYHRDLRVINDSQAGLKGFTKDQLKDILPVKINGDGTRTYDHTFDYGLSSDVALMARAVKKGYGIKEIPIIDTFEMSPKLEDHPLPKLQGERVKKEIAIQSKAVKDFQGVWQFVNQGGEYQTFSFPSLNVVMQVPRDTNDNIRAFFTSGGDLAESTGRPVAMKIASAMLATSVTRTFFYWYLHHCINKNENEEKKKLVEIRQKLGGLTVPFEIVENPAVNVFYSFKQVTVTFLRTVFAKITFPIRRSVRFIVNKMFEIKVPMPERLFQILSYIVRGSTRSMVSILTRSYDLFSSVMKKIAGIQPFKVLVIYINNFLKFDRPGIILIYPVKLFRWVSDQTTKISTFITENIGFLPDNSEFISEQIKKGDVVTRPIWKAGFIVTDSISELVRNLIGPVRLEPEYALIKEKVVSFGDVLIRLDKEKSIREAKELVDQFVEFQKELWKRGAFDHESHLLGDIGFDSNGRIVISDLGVITFDLKEALYKLRPENKNRDFMTQEVLRRSLSSEVYDYYVRRIKEEITEENIIKLWGIEADKCMPVPSPEGIPANAFLLSTEEEIIAKLFDELIELAKSEREERASEYLDNTQDRTVIMTKVILRALRKGGWRERKVAVDIAQRTGRILSRSSYFKEQINNEMFINWIAAFNSILRGSPVKDMLTRYFKPELIKETALESIFIRTILKEYTSAAIISDRTARDIYDQYGYERIHSPPVIGARTETFSAEVSYAEQLVDGIKLHGTKDINSVDVYVVNAGQGERQGLLSVQAGTKGDIAFLGRQMKEWSARTSEYMSATIKDKDNRPVFFSPTDVIYLKPRGDEINNIEKTLAEEKRIVFFSPQERPLKPDLSGALVEDIGEIVLEALFEIPGLGKDIVDKFVVPYLRNAERKALTEENGGYDFPGSWVIKRDSIEEAADLFGYNKGNIKVAWWVYLRLPIRVRARFWRAMKDKLSSGFDEEQWMNWREKIRDFVMKEGAYAKTLVHPWIDCNTPLELFNIYRGIVNRDDMLWRVRLRETFEIERSADIVESKINGAFECRGNFFINGSRINIAEGVSLVLGNNVVIDNSLIEIKGNPGEKVFIPDGTVIAYSNISGEVAEFYGRGEENFLHGVYATDGFAFMTKGRIFASLVLKDNKKTALYSQEYEFTGTKNVPLPAKNDIDRKKMNNILVSREFTEQIKNKAPPKVPVKELPDISLTEKPIAKIQDPAQLPDQVVTITGATGFIASHLSEQLIKENIPVAATVRPNSTNISNIPLRENLHLVDLDFNHPDYNKLKELVKRSKVVYHLGALGNQALTMDLPAEAYVSNALTTAIIGALCEKFNKRLLFSSSFVVYDLGKLQEGEQADENSVLPDPEKYPEHAKWLDDAEKAFDMYVSELISNEGKVGKDPLTFVDEYLTNNPLPGADYRMLGQNYPLSKLLAERLVLKKKTGVVLRVNNVYGPGQPEETMLPFFIKSIIRGKEGSKLKVWPVKRDIIYVKDLAVLLREFADLDIPDKKRLVNLATGNYISAKQLAETVKSVLHIEDKEDQTGEGVKIVVEKEKKKELMPSLRISNKRLNSLTDKKEFTSLEKGMEETAEYYLSKYLHGCTPEHIAEVLKYEFKGRAVTAYQILKRKRYSKAALIRALKILERNKLITVNMERGIRTYKVNDIYNAVSFMDNVFPEEKIKGSVYEIRYDSARLREYTSATGLEKGCSPEDLLTAYVKCLQIRVPCADDQEAKNVIKLIECPSRENNPQSLISVVCYRDMSKTEVTGEASVDIEGEITGRALKIIGMLNIAITASSIPKTAKELTGYTGLIETIKDQFRQITGKELGRDEYGKELSAGELLRAIRTIVLPDITPVPIESLKDYYKFTIENILRAA